MNARYIRHLMHCQPTVVRIQAADSQTIVPGDLVAIVSGKVTKVSDSVHTLVLGIALNSITTTTAAATDLVDVLILDEFSVIRMAYEGTATIAQANLFTTAYDVTAAQVVHADDTTGGFLVPVSLPDAVTTGYIDVVVKASVLWNA